MIPGLAGIAGFVQSKGVSAELVGVFEDGVDRSNYTFSGITIPRDGLVVVVAGVRKTGAGSAVFTAFNIGGTSSTMHATNNDSGGEAAVAISSREVNAGTIDVNFTTSISNLGATAVVYLVEGYESSTPTETFVDKTASPFEFTTTDTGCYFAGVCARSPATVTYDSSGMTVDSNERAGGASSGAGMLLVASGKLEASLEQVFSSDDSAVMVAAGWA